MFGPLAASQFQVTGPPKNPNGSYSTVDIQQEIDDAANLDDTKKAKAEYWADGPASVFPPGHDFIFAQALSRKKGHSLDTDVKLFFMLGNAMMDASIASWWPEVQVRLRPADHRHPLPPQLQGQAGQLLARARTRASAWSPARSGCPTRRSTW